MDGLNESFAESIGEVPKSTQVGNEGMGDEVDLRMEAIAKEHLETMHARPDNTVSSEFETSVIVTTGDDTVVEAEGDKILKEKVEDLETNLVIEKSKVLSMEIAAREEKTEWLNMMIKANIKKILII